MSDVVVAPEGWAVQHSPADNAVGTISRAAVALCKHIVTSITVSLSGAANTTALVFVLRDSTTGAGNILWTVKLCNLANTSETVQVPVNIPGVKGQAVTLETTAAPAASSRVTVAMNGYTVVEPV
mgnify:CR=1 FL=1